MMSNCFEWNGIHAEQRQGRSNSCFEKSGIQEIIYKEEKTMNRENLPSAIIGAGPIGLAAAVHLLTKGETPIVFEAGSSVGAAVLQWGHVRLFSPWRYVIDREAQALLEKNGWRAPDSEAYPTDRELVERYLVPLANLPQMQPHLHLDTRVTSVSRQGLDRLKTAGRQDAPFVLRLETAGGEEQEVLARAVIDASGTYAMPNPLGANGTLRWVSEGCTSASFTGSPTCWASSVPAMLASASWSSAAVTPP
jgi:cation diffusion facilitator CzcD-associated flavoprotein CzcO